MTTTQTSRPTAVRHKPLSVPHVGELLALARADWGTEAVAAFLDERGWGSVPGAFGWLTDAGHRLSAMDPEPQAGRHAGFFLEFAYHHADADDQYAEDLLGADFAWADWAATPAGDDAAPAFDAAWADAAAAVTAVLGLPETRFAHDDGADQWDFAAWRVENRALVLAQGEEFRTYGELEMNAVWLIPHPASAPFPGPADFYDWLVSPHAA